MSNSSEMKILSITPEEGMPGSSVVLTTKGTFYVDTFDMTVSCPCGHYFEIDGECPEGHISPYMLII